MAEGKDIPINIKTTADTSGVEKAEAAIKNITEAGTSSEEKLKAASAEHAAAMEKANEWADELREGLSDLEKGIDDLTESSEEANEQGEALDENVKNISRAERGRAVADLAKGVGAIGGKFREAASEVREFDADAADAFERTADRIEGVSSAVSSLALGFAAGGPLGAGVAAAGIGVMALVNAFKEAEVAAIKAAAMERKALEETAQAARDAATAARERAFELSSDQIEAGIQRQNEAIERGLQLLNDQLAAARQRRREEEEILKAKDKLELAKIDESEAKGEITAPEAEQRRSDVQVGAAKRADDERKADALKVAEKARADAELQAEAFAVAEEQKAAAAERVRQAQEELASAQKENKLVTDRENAREFARAEKDKMVGSIYNIASGGDVGKEAKEAFEKTEAGLNQVRPGVTPEMTAEKIAEAEKKLQELQTKLTQAEEAVNSQAKVAGASMSDVDKAAAAAKSTITTVDTRAGIEAQERAAQERALQARQAREDAKQRDLEERAAANAARDAANNNLSALAAGNRSRIRNSDKGRSNNDLAGLADEIGRADTTAEINAVRDAVKAKSGELGTAVVQALGAMISQQERLVAMVQGFDNRLKALDLKIKLNR